MSQRLVHLSALIGVLVLAGFVAAAAGAFAVSDSTIQLVAMDADPTGNTATTLGHLDPCIRTELGSDVTVDLVVDAVPGDRPFIGYQVNIDYDPSLLEVIAVDSGFLLGASGDFEPFEGTEPLPDSDGSFTIIIADLASNAPPGANMETGEGVLSRVTLRAKAAGVSTVAPGFDPPDVYPALIDLNNTTIEVRTIAGIKVAIGQDCPEMTWGDVNCDGGVDAVDALDALKAVAEISARYVPGCPPPGRDIDFTEGALAWGDVDCSRRLSAVDALKVLRAVASLPVTQSEPCPDIGTDVNLQP